MKGRQEKGEREGQRQRRKGRDKVPTSFRDVQRLKVGDMAADDTTALRADEDSFREGRGGGSR